MRCLLLPLLLPGMAVAAEPAQAPVRPGSPAWEALLDLPIREGDTLAHGAAEQLLRWQQPEAAERLRRQLLALHWRAAADPTQLPQTDERLRRLFAPEAGVPSVDALAEAARQALGASIRLAPITAKAPADHVPLSPVPAVPGLWKPERKGHGLGHWRLTNVGLLALSLPSQSLGLQWGAVEVPARCGLLQREQRIAPGASADWACALDAPIPADASGQPRWNWRAPLLLVGADRAREAQRLAPPSGSRAAALQRQFGDCESQQNCSPAQRQALKDAEQARQQAVLEARQARDAAALEARQRERRAELGRLAWAVGALIGGQFLFVLLARFSGGVWLGSLLVIAGGGGLCFWLLREASQTSRDSFAPLVLAMAGVGALGAGVLLAAAYAWIYRQFFARRAQAPAARTRPKPAAVSSTAPRAAEAAVAPSLPPAPAPAPVAPPTRLACPHCVSPFAHLRLPGHYGAEVQLDHCDACRLLWFDTGELGRLSGRGWTALLHRLVDSAERAAPQPARADAACPHCQTRLQAVHDQTLFGRFVGQACPRGHGSAQRDAALFAARGLFRRPHALEAASLKGESAACLACGAAREPDAGDCSYCGSPPLVVDLKRLTQSLGLAERRSTLGQGQGLLWSCAGCGQALDAAAHSSCPQCAHPVLALRVEALRPLLEAALAQPADTPAALQAARQAQAEALIAHERMKVEWQREARPRSPVMVMLLGLVRLLGRRD